MSLQFCVDLFGQSVDDEVPLPACFNHFVGTQIRKVLRDFHLWLIQDFLEMTNAERPAREQLQDTQARSIAEALINLNQVHQQRGAVPQQLASVFAFRRSRARHWVRLFANLMSKYFRVLFTCSIGYCPTTQQSYSTSTLRFCVGSTRPPSVRIFASCPAVR